MLPIALCLPAQGVEIDGEFTLLYRYWDELNVLTGAEEQRAPLYGFLNLRSSDLGLEGLRFFVSGLALVETGDKSSDPNLDDDEAGSLYSAYAQWLNPKGSIELRLGRQTILSTSRRIYLDGCRGRFEVVPGHIRVDVYGGMWRLLQAGGYERNPGPAFGATMELVGPGPVMIAAGYNTRGEDDQEIERIQARLQSYIPGFFQLLADGEYDLDQSALLRYAAALHLPFGENFRLAIEGEQYDPEPDPYDEGDIFRLFVKDEGYRYGTRLLYSLPAETDLYLCVSLQRFDLLSGTGEKGARIEAGVSGELQDEMDLRYELSGLSLDGGIGKLRGAAGSVAGKPFHPDLIMGVSFDYERFKEDDLDWDQAFTASIYGEYVPVDHFLFGIRVEASSDPDYRVNIRPGFKVGVRL